MSDTAAAAIGGGTMGIAMLCMCAAGVIFLQARANLRRRRTLLEERRETEGAEELSLKLAGHWQRISSGFRQHDHKATARLDARKRDLVLHGGSSGKVDSAADSGGERKRIYAVAGRGGGMGLTSFDMNARLAQFSGKVKGLKRATERMKSRVSRMSSHPREKPHRHRKHRHHDSQEGSGESQDQASAEGKQDNGVPEIDTGVGGAVAEAIGKRLARLAGNVQVLTVTHAPQVAARAGGHFLILKEDADEERVATRVRRIDVEHRREEIARMLAGATITDEARAAADRLLADAPAQG